MGDEAAEQDRGEGAGEEVERRPGGGGGQGGAGEEGRLPGPHLVLGVGRAGEGGLTSHSRCRLSTSSCSLLRPSSTILATLRYSSSISASKLRTWVSRRAEPTCFSRTPRC